jgi:hypothetical protein
LQLDEVGRRAGTQAGDGSSAASDRGSKAAEKIASGELSVDKASIKAVTSAGGIDRSQRDAGNVAALSVLYCSGAGGAAFNNDGVPRSASASKASSTVVVSVSRSASSRLGAKMSTCA